MFKHIVQLFGLLTPDQRRRIFVLQVLIVLMALFEVIGIVSIGPFIAIVSDPNVIQTNSSLQSLYQWSGSQTHSEFLFLVGLLVFSLLAVAAMTSMFTIWRLSLFSAQVGTEIANRLYTYYMQQDWLFHASSSSAQLTKQITTEASRVTNSVIQPLMQMNARIVLAMLILIGLVAYNPLVALTGFVVFAVAYFLLYRVVKNQLQKNGAIISKIMTTRFRLMNEGFGGIKDVLLLGRKKDFLDQFEKSGHAFAHASSTNATISYVPRYLMELIAFGSIIGLVLLLLASESQDIAVVLPILAVYALAGFKLLPALQQIYASITQIKGNIAGFEAIRDDLLASQKKLFSDEVLSKAVQANERLLLKEHIWLKGVTFAYPGKTPVLKNLDLKIAANSVIGIVGPSGSGKSTAIDILLALIQPQAGELKVDDTVITPENRRAWQNTIGFVPQSIFLSEGTIAENVAFGIPEKDINLDQVKKALSLAHLDELVKTLDQGIHSKVGERGVKLSGGQRQRIGIARALYHEADVLVFDEATSSLDGITEKMIMEAIHDFSGKKTIIMVAHRLQTVEKCDQIFFIDQGQVVDQGTYPELIQKNDYFKRMASHA